MEDLCCASKIRYVAKSCGSAISKKNTKNVYKDHPAVLDIVMEVYTEVQI